MEAQSRSRTKDETLLGPQAEGTQVTQDGNTSYANDPY